MFFNFENSELLTWIYVGVEEDDEVLGDIITTEASTSTSHRSNVPNYIKI